MHTIFEPKRIDTKKVAQLLSLLGRRVISSGIKFFFRMLSIICLGFSIRKLCWPMREATNITDGRLISHILALLDYLSYFSTILIVIFICVFLSNWWSDEHWHDKWHAFLIRKQLNLFDCLFYHAVPCTHIFSLKTWIICNQNKQFRVFLLNSLVFTMH